MLSRLLSLAREQGVDLLGEPRLVRLNPNVPWKTRGNAALSGRFGRGKGRRFRVGQDRQGFLYGYSRGRELSTTVRSSFAESAWKLVRSLSRIGETGTDPAMVTSLRPLAVPIYREAVGRMVPVSAARRYLDDAGGDSFLEGGDRGLVGACAALGWPGRRATWELIGYRTPDATGRVRWVNRKSVEWVRSQQGSLFLCTDPRTRRLLVAPHTPCPIVLGLRSTRRASLAPALKGIRSEPIDRWTIFRTNQGTGDHLRFGVRNRAQAYASATVDGRVDSDPDVRPGGHVSFSVRTPEGTVIPSITFEPSKTLPAVARALQPGDHVRLWGGYGADPTLRVEGIVVRSLSPRVISRPPACPSCGRNTSSLGTGRGYRCPRCRRRLAPELRRRLEVASPISVGVYHPTPSARRHLHPLGPEGWRFHEPSDRSNGLC